MNAYTIKAVCLSNCGILNSLENKHMNLKFWHYFWDYYALCCAKYNHNRPMGFLSHGMAGLRYK